MNGDSHLPNISASSDLGSLGSRRLLPPRPPIIIFHIHSFLESQVQVRVQVQVSRSIGG